MPFSASLYIEQDDFREDPPKKFFRLAPGREVRLRYAYFVTCTGVVKDDSRRDRRAALHLRPRHPRRRRPDGRKVKATIHWVSAAHAVDAEVRLYDHLFTKPDPDDVRRGRGLQRQPQSRTRSKSLTGCQARARRWPTPRPASRYQFERLGYFCVDPRLHARQARSSTARSRCKDTWAKIEKTAIGKKGLTFTHP